MPERISVYLLSPADRPHYRAEWNEPGTTIRRSRTMRTADPDLAERRRADLEYELNHGIGGKLAAVTWEAFRERYFEERLAAKKRGTRVRASTIFGRFGRVARPASLGAIDGPTLVRYAAGMRREEYRPATIHGHLAYLGAALRWAARQGLIAAAPRVEMPNVPKRRRFRVLTPERYPNLLGSMPSPAWRLLLQIAWYTGMRRTELVTLHWEPRDVEPWVDLERGRIWIPPETGKSNREEWIPAHPELVDLLRAVERPEGLVVGLGLSADHVSRHFAALARAAGHNLTLHDLRRSFGTRYAPLVPAQVLMRLMRHADIATTLEFYADLDTSLDDAIRKL